VECYDHGAENGVRRFADLWHIAGEISVKGGEILIDRGGQGMRTFLLTTFQGKISGREGNSPQRAACFRGYAGKIGKARQSGINTEANISSPRQQSKTALFN